MRLNNMAAIQAQKALGELSSRDDIPIRASLDIALISNTIDTQIKAYGVVLQNLYKKYAIKPEPNEGGRVRFTCTTSGETEEETAKLRGENLEAFAGKLNDLLEANTADIQFQKIRLPEDIKVKPEVLKALTEFVEIG